MLPSCCSDRPRDRAAARARDRRPLRRHRDRLRRERFCGSSSKARSPSVWWVVLSGDGRARALRRRRAPHALLERRRRRAIILRDFRDGFFPHDGGVKEFFEELKRDFAPDLVLTHARHDLHQDHRIDVRAHLEHIPRPPDPRVRDPQVRRRPRLPEPLRAARRTTSARRKVDAPARALRTPSEPSTGSRRTCSPACCGYAASSASRRPPTPRASTAARRCWREPANRTTGDTDDLHRDQARRGVHLDLERREDNRGFFARTFCQHEFAEHGLKPVDRAGQHRVQPRAGHDARDALPVSARGRDEARALHPRRDPRHHRRPAPGEPDLPRARGGRAERRQPPRALRARSASRTATRCSRTRPRRATRWASSTPRAEGGLRYDDPGSGSSWPLPVTEISEKDARWALLSEVEPRSSERMAVGERDRGGRGPMIIVDTAARASASARAPDPRRR